METVVEKIGSINGMTDQEFYLWEHSMGEETLEIVGCGTVDFFPDTDEIRQIASEDLDFF